jgi:hypothetical protein
VRVCGVVWVQVEQRGDERAKAFANLKSTFLNAVEQFGPNDFFVMQKCMKEDAPNPTLKSVVALLKLGDWDPDVFYKFRDTILNQVRHRLAIAGRGRGGPRSSERGSEGKRRGRFQPPE